MTAALTAALLSSAVLLATGASADTPCQAPLPRGPTVPAPIIFKTSCGGYRLESSGRVSRLPPHWFDIRSGGTGRRFGADLRVLRNRAGRITILRRRAVLWRSRDLYPNDAADVAFGPNLFAFSSYRRGVFLTDLKSPERLVLPGRGRFPHGFFASGRLIVTRAGEINLLSAQGRLERRYAYSRQHGYTFDEAGGTLYFVTPQTRLATLREARLQVGRRLAIEGMPMYSRPGVLLFFGARSLALVRLDGRLLARARWPRGGIDLLDSGASVSSDGRSVAFRLSNARPGAARGTAILFLLTAGKAPAFFPIYRHRLGRIGCSTSGTMSWHGRHLLYGAPEGQLKVFDTGGSPIVDLRQFATILPRRSRTEVPTASWASAYPPK